MRSIQEASKQPLSRRLMPLAWGLLTLVTLLLVLIYGALQTQLALAAFLNGESIWSKAQKQLVIDLLGYTVSGDSNSLSRFDQNFALLEFDRFARDEAIKEHYNYRQIDEALHHDNAIRESIPVVIFMFRYFPNAPYMRDALDAWRSTDAQIAQLGEIARELKGLRTAGALSQEEVRQQSARIAELNDYIQPRTNLFSSSIAHGATWLGSVLFGTLFAVACVACLIWFRMARRILASIRGTQERYSLLFDSAADAIILVDEDNGRVLDANRTASSWIGIEADKLVGARFSDLFAEDASQQALASAIGALRSSNGAARPVEMQSSLALWGDRPVRQALIRDISERIAMEQERRIAAEALASVAEGVIIADGGRRVVAVNAAHTEITGYTAEMLEGMRIDDTRQLPDMGALPESIWSTTAETGNWLGEVRTRRRDGSTYLERLSISAIRDEHGRVEHYVAVFADITELKANQLRLEHMASHDPLTHLINRAEFEERCAQAIALAEADHMAAAVLFIDLDAFKIVNDSFSHAIGDQLLIMVAQRISRQLAPNDVAGRLGGDEFTVLVPRLSLREDATGLANRLLASLAEPYVINDHEIIVSASIGIAGYPLDARDAAALIANADAAMYAAKLKERNSVRLYSPIMHANTRRRLQLAAELRQALAREEFHMLYQPSVELRNGRIVALESLVRWRHPERGLIPPSEFIPIAENLGVIRQVDQWVMRTVFAQIAEWDQAGMPPVRVAVNVSASWFGHHAFVEFLSRALVSSNVSPSRILLEITESSMLRMGEDTDRIMHELHAMGVNVAIDDFGTGYSSLSYLKMPAIAYVKIDGSFVAGLPLDTNDVAITQAILAIAKSLGLRTIAEGIEIEAQHDFLLRAGCAEGQGYLYAHPLPADEISHLLMPNPKRVKTRLQLVTPKDA